MLFHVINPNGTGSIRLPSFLLLTLFRFVVGLSVIVYPCTARGFGIKPTRVQGLKTIRLQLGVGFCPRQCRIACHLCCEETGKDLRIKPAQN